MIPLIIGGYLGLGALSDLVLWFTIDERTQHGWLWILWLFAWPIVWLALLSDLTDLFHK